MTGLISLSYSYNHNNKYGDVYPHFYTGAFISEGYPSRSPASSMFPFFMYFGGQPSHTYTTIRLHSSPSLLSGASLKVKSDVSQLTGGFTTELHTPLSIYTADSGYVIVEMPRSTSQDSPAFLFSFKGIALSPVVATFTEYSHAKSCSIYKPASA